MGAKIIILTEGGTTMKLRSETPAGSFALRKSPERGVSSPYISRTNRPAGVAGKSNLAARARVCEAAFSRGAIGGSVGEKFPPLKRS